ncbi:hypothetical protein CPC08DRAFT_707808 [Agrocybe pediades]|nr:hypothetical protein CPC08DRAFT_707808 [Agrocybe pediades]
MPSASDYHPSGMLSNLVSRIGRSRTLRNCRTYYRYALFAVSITCFLNALELVLSLVRFAIFDVIYFTTMTFVAGLFAAAIHYLLKYSNMPDSSHWLTYAQTHIMGSSLIAIFMTSYSSFLQAPFSGALRVCLTMNTRDFLGNVRCYVVTAMGFISWTAPIAMFIAAWVVYFSAIHAQSQGIWRHANVSEVNEPYGEVSLPYDA